MFFHSTDRRTQRKCIVFQKKRKGRQKLDCGIGRVVMDYESFVLVRDKLARAHTSKIGSCRDYKFVGHVVEKDIIELKDTTI